MNKLYIIPGSCSTGIHALFHELNKAVDIVPRDSVENYTAIAPTNQVPALQTENTLLLEGSAIAIHLIREYGDSSITENQDFLRWLMFNYATLHPAYSKLFTVNGAMDDSAEKNVLLQTLGNRVSELWHIVDQHLADRPYMLGDTPSIIDYLLAVYVNWGNNFPSTQIDIGSNIVELVNRVLALPQFQSALTQEGVDYQIPGSAIAA